MGIRPKKRMRSVILIENLIYFLFFWSDPAIQPTKPIANLQAKDENQFRKVPKGRYDTTYRREYLNFNNVNTIYFLKLFFKSV